MKTPLRKIGNSQGILLPKPLLAQIGVAEDELEMTVEENAIVLRKARKPREGWGRKLGEEPEELADEDEEWLEAPLDSLDPETEWVWK